LSPSHRGNSGRIQILSRGCIVRRLPKSSNNYMWLQSTFLSYPTNFLTSKRTISSCHHAIVEIVDGPKSFHVDALCVDYPSHLKLHVVRKYFSNYENSIILAPCHSRNSGRTQILSSGCIVRRLPESSKVTCGHEVLL
jgi:hypothetical protein